jgi:tripartite-type tricarboxylate transporter receptor subunit TctC
MKAKKARMSTKACFLLLGLFLTLSFHSVLHAADPEYPNKTITLVVPFSAGGITDLGARALAESMQVYLKQPVVVVDKTGGGGTVGGYDVASAKPDGYTLLYGPGSVGNPEVFSQFFKAPYSSKDIEPICSIQTVVLVIAIKEDAPWNSLKDLIEYARKNPGMKYGYPGKRTLQYVIMTIIAKQEKLTFVDVPYQGDGPLVPAILGGHVPVGLVGFPAVKSLWEAKKVKLLGVLLKRRSIYAPDVPTVDELGYKIPWAGFNGLWGPKGIPNDVAKRLDEVVAKISKDEEFKNKSKNIGSEIDYEDTATFKKTVIQYRANVSAFWEGQEMAK